MMPYFLNRKFLSSCMSLLLVGLFLSNCNFDTLPQPEPADDCDMNVPTYIAEVQPIINTYCAYSGCHANGFASGDFTDYAGMLSRLDNGSIENRAISIQDMPPSNASGPKEISMEDLEILTCWLNNDYPEME